jgi:hypothetical protein
MIAAALFTLLTQDGGLMMEPPANPAPVASSAPAPAPAAAPPAAAPAPAPGGRSLNLLVGLPPPVTVKVQNAERMTDGKAPEPGDNWQSEYTTVIPADGSVTWDFGVPTEFDGAWIQADNNDIYGLSTSDDGVNFTKVWETLTFDMGAGMQARWSTSPLHARGRYLRLTARGGDGMFSVGELAVFKDFASAKPYLPSYVRNVVQPPPPCDGNWAVIAAVLFGVVFLVRRLKPQDVRTEEAAPAAPASQTPDKK